MANDRLWLICRVCLSRSPLIGKWWATEFQMWPKAKTDEEEDVCMGELQDWISEHWTICFGCNNRPQFGCIGEEENLEVAPPVE